MKPSKKTEEQHIPKITYAITIRGEGPFLCEPILLTLADGVVVDQKSLGVANLPAYSMGAGQKALWKIWRDNK
jgi:hypothetical protein